MTGLLHCTTHGLATVGVLAALLGSAGCARLHHSQFADIDSTAGELKPFELQVSSTGISVSEGATVARALASDARTRRNVNTVETVLLLSQMGPKTGDPTFDDDWADTVAQRLLERCPSGRVTGLSVRRESMDYPVISGEIVTVRGYCVL